MIRPRAIFAKASLKIHYRYHEGGFMRKIVYLLNTKRCISLISSPILKP
ncbi:hypothetical protein NSE_0106 [Neorickettsia sennetsu str. Miyayama]|uniref:Uncharacterized protein n=1 Tax=Ehrlichia sennetsu (strain ATCC VR-367 / Miyayama) TaxID=222891 RepID=Q2GEU0_EHRS3|nr:hypothetical protein NSE_0106 [Neorickettsia sennetsu str. Miyayama]